MHMRKIGLKIIYYWRPVKEYFEICFLMQMIFDFFDAFDVKDFTPDLLFYFYLYHDLAFETIDCSNIFVLERKEKVWQ